MPKWTHADTIIWYGTEPDENCCKECRAWVRERREVTMPRWGDRMDQLERALDCYHTDAFGMYACDRCTPPPVHDPYKAIRATAAQGMARPHWVGGQPAPR